MLLPPEHLLGPLSDPGDDDVQPARGATGLAARHLWGENEDGKTWEYVYFLEPEIVEQDIPYEELNRAAGYQLNFVPNGFTPMGERKGERVLQAFNLDEGTFVTRVREENFRAAVDKLAQLEGDLDVEIKSKARVEQSFLRQQLFGRSKDARCALCGRSFPVDLLIAAHVKRRADCSTEERKDYRNNVMAVCRFGCDDLFERGYVVVKGARVLRVLERYDAATPPVQKYIDRWLHGRSCSTFTEGSAPYFGWHRERYSSA